MNKYVTGHNIYYLQIIIQVEVICISYLVFYKLFYSAVMYGGRERLTYCNLRKQLHKTPAN